MFMPFAGFALSFAPHFISYHNYYYYYDLFASRNAYKIKKTYQYRLLTIKNN